MNIDIYLKNGYPTLVVDGKKLNRISKTRYSNGTEKFSFEYDSLPAFIKEDPFGGIFKKQLDLAVNNAQPQHVYKDEWPELNLLVQNYMWRRKSGAPTDGKERMILADALAKHVGCTASCAWNWSKENAPRPREKNIEKLKSFFRESL